jgi:hypothetical protein
MVEFQLSLTRQKAVLITFRALKDNLPKLILSLGDYLSDFNAFALDSDRPLTRSATTRDTRIW